MNITILRPRKDILKIKGRISYNNGWGAWNTIRFRQELIQEFPQLREKRSEFFYEMLFYRAYEELEKAIKEIKENKEAMPILLFLHKKKEKVE